MESQAELLQKVRFCMAFNTPKLVIALLTMGITGGLISSVLMIPIHALVISGNMNIVLPVMFLIFSIALSTIQYIVLYGFFVLTLRVYREQNAVFGHLFVGIRDFKRAFFAGLFFTGIIGLLVLVFAFFSSFIMAPTLSVQGQVIDSQNNMIFFVVTLLAILLVPLVLHIRYGFVWFILHDQPDVRVRDAIKQSALLTKGKCLNFGLLCLKSAGPYLLTYVLTFISSFYLPASFFMNVVLLLCAYATIIRLCLVFVAWYVICSASCSYSNTGEHPLPDTVIYLSDSSTPDAPDSSENSGE